MQNIPEGFMKAETKAYAKINLYLDVLGKRADGYHNIQSIMQTVGLYDTVSVEFLPGDVREIGIVCDDAAVPCGEKNIAYKAAARYLDRVGLDGVCRISIEKRIPMEAGLAGGSADAAAVLRLLNGLCGNALTVGELCKVGATVGADVPFCIVGGTALTEGIGEVLRPVGPMPEAYVVIARGGEGVSTPAAYRAIDETYGDRLGEEHGDVVAVCDALRRGDLRALCGEMVNVFEGVVLPVHGIARRAKETMLACGAVGAMMSGSGPSVFGIFEDIADAEKAAKALREFAERVEVTVPVGVAEVG